MKQWVFCLVMIFAVIGCSGAKDHNGFAVPTFPQKTEASGVGQNRLLWGAWDVLIGADHSSVEISPLRSAEMHLNVIKMLEIYTCVQCLTIKNVHQVEPNVLEADVSLKHPYPGLIKYTGFDVRGIFMAQADFTFPVSGRRVGTGESVPRLLNADGFTSIFNPTDYPESGAQIPVFKYDSGKSATGGDLSATLNPFIAYRKDAPRRMFESGGSETRTFRIYAPPGPIHFGYAVDACWMPVDNVIDPLTDFRPRQIVSKLMKYLSQHRMPIRRWEAPRRSRWMFSTIRGWIQFHR